MKEKHKVMLAEMRRLFNELNELMISGASAASIHAAQLKARERMQDYAELQEILPSELPGLYEEFLNSKA